MQTYDFWTLDGYHLGTIATNDPDREAELLGADNLVHPEEISYEVCQETDQ